jgi:hypothetical protein
MYVYTIPQIFFPFLKSSSSFPYMLTLHLFNPHYPLPLEVKLILLSFSLPYIFVQYILQVFCSSVYVCCPSKRPAQNSVPSPMANHLVKDRVCLGLGKNQIRTLDNCSAVRCVTIEPPLLLYIPPIIHAPSSKQQHIRPLCLCTAP